MPENSYFKQVVELLRVESEAIARTSGRLSRAEVERAVELLNHCQGKVVLVGVGKSGHIALKIAATLTSTGTAAIYLHPSDALHGGLGIVMRGDLVIALSNSGETDEVITMLPYLKHRDVPIIALVGNVNSTLARRADVVLDASVDQEACPLNLAPTTSTTVALALGDALAMTLMEAKGWTPDDFALNHPAGQLGKRLTLKVADLMHSGPENPVIGMNAPWLEVLDALTRGRLGAVNVLDQRGRLEGIITDGDLRRAMQKINHAELEHLRSDAIMTRSPVIASPDLLAYDALRLMEDRPFQIAVLPVVDEDGLCVGLIRLHDIVRSGL
ncbi:MAG: arabinose-5-phosphate isomerase [Blastocatellia bacterium]|jgi:arabinose-5-phosphate isomerase|nr:arabinose-5-phosphate isomerase [Blastocatellia bacterium]